MAAELRKIWSAISERPIHVRERLRFHGCRSFPKAIRQTVGKLPIQAAGLFSAVRSTRGGPRCVSRMFPNYDFATHAAFR